MRFDNQEAVRRRAEAHLTVLVVDDEDGIRQALSRLLNVYGFEVLLADCGEQALEHLARHPGVCVVLLDQSMPKGSGASFAPRMRVLCPKVRLVFHSAQDVRPEDRSLVDDVIRKPADTVALLELLDRWTLSGLPAQAAVAGGCA